MDQHISFAELVFENPIDIIVVLKPKKILDKAINYLNTL